MKATHKTYRIISESRMEELESSLELLKEIQEDLEMYLEDMRKSAEINISAPVSLGSLFFPDSPTFEQVKDFF